MLWSPEIDIIASGLGTNFALWSIHRRQLGKPVHPDATRVDGWPLVFAAAPSAEPCEDQIGMEE